jgi:hypothetical protein
MTTTAPMRPPEKRGSGWWVASATCPGYGYTIFKDAAGWHCQCPSHRWRRSKLPGGQCRHVHEVLRMLRKEGGE